MATELIVHPTVAYTLDEGRPEADAVLIRGDRIVAVGSLPSCRAGAPGAEVLEFEGALVPGLTDGHCHVGRQPQRLATVDLSQARRVSDAVQLLRSARREPIVAWGWDESLMGEPLTTELLDQGVPGKPVLAIRVCGHKAVASTPLVRRMGWPSGLLLEGPVSDAWEALAPKPKEAATLAADAWRPLLEQGVTSVHDMADAGTLANYEAAPTAPRPRAVAYTTPECLDAYPRVPPVVHHQGVKLYTDGSLGARTAAVRDPWRYADGACGMLLLDRNDVRSWAEKCRACAWQLACHAIGNAAIDEVLAGLEGVGHARPPRIEHAELLDDDQIHRMARVGAVASMQPNFIGNWGLKGGLYADRLGPGAVEAHNPLRALIDAGVPVIIGTDGMPEDVPFAMFWAMHGPSPRQRLTPAETLAAVTRVPAEITGSGGGRLVAGAPADVAVLDVDPIRRPGELKEARSVLTILGGRVLHRGNPTGA